MRGVTIEEVQARTGIRVESLRRELGTLAKLSKVAEGRWIHADVLADFRKRAIAFLDRYFKTNKIAINVPKSEFGQKVLPHETDPGLASFLFDDLAREKIAVVRGDVVEIPGRSKELGGAEGELARAIEKRFADAGLAPPPVSELIQTIAQKPKVIEGVVSFLVKQGTLVRLAEGVYVHQRTIAEAREKMAARKGETIDVGQFKELFGLSRKIAIPLLEWFDRTGVTKRTGDVRQVL
jgi:selenocysteine-specific elongation factor